MVLFEDYHYADPGLLDFVDHLLERSRTVPIYVVTLSRPECSFCATRAMTWAAGKRNFLQRQRAPAARTGHALALLAGLVPGLPERAVQAIGARATASRLYAVEMLCMLLAENRLVLEGNAYQPTGDLTGDSPPVRTPHGAHRLAPRIAPPRPIAPSSRMPPQYLGRASRWPWPPGRARGCRASRPA